MKTIEAWAAVNEVGNIINITWTESVRNLWNSQGARIVKLTGQMPEKVKKTVWANMYKQENMIVAVGTYASQEEAESIAKGLHGYLGAHSITVEVDE